MLHVDVLLHECCLGRMQHVDVLPPQGGLGRMLHVDVLCLSLIHI